MKLRHTTRAPEVARDIYRLGSRWVNFHLVVEGEDAVLVDAGYPRYLKQLQRSVEAAGLRLEAIAAVIVTHHHVDHSGTAEAVRARAGATVLVGGDDAAKVRGERASHPPQGFWGEGWRPSMIRYLAHSAAAGGTRYRPVVEVRVLEDDTSLDLPGRPRLIATPGHTAGHYSVLMEERGVLFTGDAIVNFDYATGKRGLNLHRFNEDREAAIASLDRLTHLDAEALLFGHGDPWTYGADRAVNTVRGIMNRAASRREGPRDR